MINFRDKEIHSLTHCGFLNFEDICHIYFRDIFQNNYKDMGYRDSPPPFQGLIFPLMLMCLYLNVWQKCAYMQAGQCNLIACVLPYTNSWVGNFINKCLWIWPDDISVILMNESRLVSADFFFKINSFQKFFQECHQKVNNLDPDQAWHLVRPDLGPNYLQRLSADDLGALASSDVIYQWQWKIFLLLCSE